MTTNRSRFENVPFRFVAFDEVSNLIGDVTTEPQGMLLDIPAGPCGGERPYAVTGILRDGYFEGGDWTVRGDPVTVKWASIGNEYVGVWFEGGEQYLFTFSLNLDARAAARSRRARAEDALRVRVPGSYETSRRR